MLQLDRASGSALARARHAAVDENKLDKLRASHGSSPSLLSPRAVTTRLSTLTTPFQGGAMSVYRRAAINADNSHAVHRV